MLVLRGVLLGSCPSHLQPHRQALSSAWVRRKLPASPATVILSIVVDFLQRWSFIISGTKTRAGPRVALLTGLKDTLTAAHLVDARRALPRHSCQGPQGRGDGRTSGVK